MDVNECNIIWLLRDNELEQARTAIVEGLVFALKDWLHAYSSKELRLIWTQDEVYRVHWYIHIKGCSSWQQKQVLQRSSQPQVLTVLPCLIKRKGKK